MCWNIIRSNWVQFRINKIKTLSMYLTLLENSIPLPLTLITLLSWALNTGTCTPILSLQLYIACHWLMKSIECGSKNISPVLWTIMIQNYMLYKLSIGKFAWQETASAFSVSKGDVDKVCKYILNQPEHHRKVSFAEEYESFLKFYQKSLRYQK